MHQGMTMNKIILFSILVLTQNALSLSISKEDSLTNLILKYVESRKLNYIKNDSILFEDVTMFLEKTDVSISELEAIILSSLDMSGITFYENKELNTIELYNQRDVRYKALPQVTTPDEIPDNDLKFYRFLYSPKYISSDDLSRNLRPLVSRFGRIIADKSNIIFFDKGTNLKLYAEMIKKIDTPLYREQLLNVKKLDEIESVEIKETKSYLDIITDSHVLFIILFSLIFFIFGFSLRSFVIKKFDGGW